MVYHDLIILLHFTIDYAFEVLLHLLYLCDGNTIPWCAVHLFPMPYSATAHW